MSRLRSTIKSAINRALLLSVQHTEFQTGEWSIESCFVQRGQYTMVDRIDWTGSARWGAGPSGPEGADVGMLGLVPRRQWNWWVRCEELG